MEPIDIVNFMVPAFSKPHDQVAPIERLATKAFLEFLQANAIVRNTVGNNIHLAWGWNGPNKRITDLYERLSAVPGLLGRFATAEMLTKAELEICEAYMFFCRQALEMQAETTPILESLLSYAKLMDKISAKK